MTITKRQKGFVLPPLKKAQRANGTPAPGGLPETASAAAIGEALGLTARRIRQIAAERGVLPVGHGKLPLAAALQAVVEAARSERATSLEGLARADLIRIRTQEIELRNAERMRELIPLDDANFAIDEIVGAIVAELVGLPRRLTRDPKLMREYEDEIDEMRRRVAVTVQKKAEELING